MRYIHLVLMALVLNIGAYLVIHSGILNFDIHYSNTLMDTIQSSEEQLEGNYTPASEFDILKKVQNVFGTFSSVLTMGWMEDIVPEQIKENEYMQNVITAGRVIGTFLFVLALLVVVARIYQKTL